MKNLKKIIIIISIIIIILFVFILNLTRNSSEESNKEDYELIEGSQDIKETLTKTFSKISNHNVYFTVKHILEEYTKYFEYINADTKIEVGRVQMTEQEIRNENYKYGMEAIFKLFDKQYTDENNISEDFIKSFVEKYKNSNKDNSYIVDIKNIYIADIEPDLVVALVYSQINNVEFDFMIKLDYTNTTYSMFWNNYLEKNNYTENRTEEVNLDANKIEKNDYNMFIEIDASNEYVATQYFSDYKNKIINNTRKAYEIIDSDYKNKKYPTYEKFIEFLNDIRDRIDDLQVSKYKFSQDELKVLDNYNNIYTFKVNAIMDYTILLDDYTIEDEEIIELYEKSSDQDKVYANIEKFFKMLNTKDYESAYNLLDNTFKQNNYKSVEAFKNFVNNSLYSYSVISKSESLEKNGEYYICLVNITNGENINDSSKEMTIIMQLKENRDFVMSFNLE